MTLDDSVEIGPHCVLTGPVTLGPGCVLIGHAYLNGPLTMGKGNVVYPYACLGFAPQHTAFDPNEPGEGLVIGDGNSFREQVTIHRAFTDEGPTRIGDENYFMVASHVGHDCIVGNHNMLVNNSALGGHVIVEDHVIVGGGTMVHQFCRLGKGAMLSGGMATGSDIAPWFMLTGDDVCGSVNLIGMRRHGLTREHIDDVRWVYKTLYRKGFTLKQAVEKLKERKDNPVISDYLHFVNASKRGLCPAVGKAARGSA